MDKMFSKNFIINQELVKQFSEISGDRNPIHLSKSFAKKTKFKRPIAHGMLIGSLISSVIANDFPGPGSIYLSQQLNFRKPVYIGTIVTIKLKIITVKKDKPIGEIETKVFENKDCLIDGFALILNDNF